MQGVASEFALNHNTIALLHVQSTQINEKDFKPISYNEHLKNLFSSDTKLQIIPL